MNVRIEPRSLPLSIEVRPPTSGRVDMRLVDSIGRWLKVESVSADDVDDRYERLAKFRDDVEAGFGELSAELRSEKQPSRRPQPLSFALHSWSRPRAAGVDGAGAFVGCGAALSFVAFLIAPLLGFVLLALTGALAALVILAWSFAQVTEPLARWLDRRAGFVRVVAGTSGITPGTHGLGTLEQGFAQMESCWYVALSDRLVVGPVLDQPSRSARFVGREALRQRPATEERERQKARAETAAARISEREASRGT